MIRLNDIVVKFDNFTALHGINVHVKEGEFFTFLGPSGCGKTTTLRTITGFIEPAEGTVVVKEQDITHVPIEDRNIGIVFQSYALFPTMTVYDNIAFGLKVKKAKRAEIDQRVRDIARKVDLSDEQLQKAVSQLSGGQQQRVAWRRRWGSTSTTAAPVWTPPSTTISAWSGSTSTCSPATASWRWMAWWRAASTTACISSTISMWRARP